jgi:ribosomal protein S12 methylthiotransferase accessory factor
VIQAELANHRFLPREQADQFSCSGKGFSIERAIEGALGEAVERYSASFWWEEEIRRARRAELPGRTLDPRHLVLYEESQYTDLPYRQYTDDAVMGWVQARSLMTGESIWVPALGVFLAYPATAEEYLWATTSNGLAAGSTLEQAVTAAAMELIERDAVMIGWLNRVYADRWDPANHPDPEIRELVEAYRRRHVEVGLFGMGTDVSGVSVFLAIALDSAHLPAAVVGLGADFDAGVAAGKAISEIGQVRPALRRKLRRPDTQARLEELRADPRLVTSLHDHDLLYAHPESIARLDFLFSRPIGIREWPAADGQRGLADLVSTLGAAGHELIYYNLSTPDLAGSSLFTVRAIIPHFQPIDFGWKERRLGGRRVVTLPATLGLLPRPNTVGTLNPDPHPIA